MRGLLLLAALAWCAGGQAPAPDADEQKAIVARMREAALSYGNRTVACRGAVWGDCATGTVRRYTIETDPVLVMFLPQSAVTLGQVGKTWTKEEIRFQDYRKYDANSNIKFDEPK